MITELTADIRFGLRALGRNPAFTLTAVLVLALAIGAATAVFSIVHAVLIAELPYSNAGRIVRVFQQNSPDNIWSLSTVDFWAIRDQQRSFDAFGGVRFGGAALSGAGQPEVVTVGRASAGFFDVLSLTPQAGRLIQPGDEPVGAPPVAVVSDAFARARLGGARTAIDRAITLDGVSHTVVGVLPPGHDGLAGIAAPVWKALQLTAPDRRGPFGLRGFGRLREGVTLEAAGQDLAAISERIFPLWSSGFKDQTARFTAYPLRDTIVGTAHRQLRLVAGAVALVLLVAVANVATLMLVRAAARGHELAIRAALGASRARLAGLVVIESLVLTFLAAIGGLGVGALSLQLAGVIAPNLPRAREIGLDGWTVLVAVTLGAVSGALVSLSPVLAVLRARGSARGDARRSRIRGAFVAAEFALAVPLLLAAALLGNSFLRLQHVDPGYDSAATLVIPLGLPMLRYPNDTVVQEFFERAVQRALETPGVIAAGLATSAPPNNQGDVNNFNLVAHPVPPGGAEPVVPWSYVTPGFFAALAIPLLEGRLFSDADSTAAPPVAIVSRSWAARYFPGEPVVGQLIIEGGCYECPRTTVVGVVGDVKYSGLAGDGVGVYVPLSQSGRRQAGLFVRTAAAPEGFIAPVVAGLRGLDSELPLAGVTMAELLRRALADPGRWTAVLAAFAVAALTLAAVGVFGLMSYAVRRQQREIGVRMALGATPRDVTQMIVGRGMRYVVTGAAVGIALALIAGRWLNSLLYGVTSRDPLMFGLVLGVLLIAAFLACLVPALRAATIRPIEAIAQD